MSIKKKYRKFQRDPKLFFIDLYRNKKCKLLNTLYKHLPKKFGKGKYTIVSAVYNVELYLDDYIESIVKQRLDFQNNITLILVDDGSLDNSASIINKWVRKYPENIFYYKKNNGGQASARNLGLAFVNTEWVTFIDPDDFIDLNYFYLIDEAISQESNCCAIVTKFKMYKELTDTFHDGFQTDFCFDSPKRVLKASNLDNCVQFSSSSSIYNLRHIQKNNLSFDHRLTASFEDTKFFYEYLSFLDNETVIYLRDAIYFYRQRRNESSSTNTQWMKKAKYNEFFTFGVLEIIRIYQKKYGCIPTHIQRLILFTIIPYLQVGMITPKRITDVLSISEVKTLLEKIQESLNYVSMEVLEGFYNQPSNYFWINSIALFFKHQTLTDVRLYVNKVDVEAEKVYFRAYGNIDDFSIQVFCDGKELESLGIKAIKHCLFDDILLHEFNICYRIPKNGNIKALINEKEAKIYTDFQILDASVNCFYERYQKLHNRFIQNYIFIDSGNKADDNAEHLYRYFSKKEVSNIYYLLEKNSCHWQRLEKEGYNLVDLNSMRASKLLKESRYIFSSYLPGHYLPWLKNHTFKHQKYIFLQHGVMWSDLSKAFNAGYSQISNMIISTHSEKEEILSGNYLLHSEELLEVGLPRLENLRSQNKAKILVCPTWRSSFEKLNFEKNEDVEYLIKSSFVNEWKCVLDKLLALYDVSITLCFHQNFYRMLEQNALLSTIKSLFNSKINIVSPTEITYQQLFIESSILLTDYSSLQFDFAALNKPIVYFQFDITNFYEKDHAYGAGVYDFVKDGFGDVTYDSQMCCDSIGKLLMNQNIDNSQKFLNPSFKSSEAIYSFIMNKL